MSTISSPSSVAPGRGLCTNGAPREQSTKPLMSICLHSARESSRVNTGQHSVCQPATACLAMNSTHIAAASVTNSRLSPGRSLIAPSCIRKRPTSTTRRLMKGGVEISLPIADWWIVFNGDDLLRDVIKVSLFSGRLGRGSARNGRRTARKSSCSSFLLSPHHLAPSTWQDGTVV
ncbi:hypothetical protein P280DRAFT_321236 [Massarina eburnea CBS 473.64]|uniref:Uncharacterized protein n=1 Tax=Massarina eburnea CBS 473.64 TaxID=1395130 RepID=A0A6A6S1I5_9PLEO|nr:hypothetical protein P280DRAFT_321236 [Massarina eburnea CBS 473.64]